MPSNGENVLFIIYNITNFFPCTYFFISKECNKIVLSIIKFGETAIKESEIYLNFIKAW